MTIRFGIDYELGMDQIVIGFTIGCVSSLFSCGYAFSFLILDDLVAFQLTWQIMLIMYNLVNKGFFWLVYTLIVVCTR